MHEWEPNDYNNVLKDIPYKPKNPIKLPPELVNPRKRKRQEGKRREVNLDSFTANFYHLNLQAKCSAGKDPEFALESLRVAKLKAKMLEEHKAKNRELLSLASKNICSGKVESGKVESGKVESGKVESGKVESGKVEDSGDEVADTDSAGVSNEILKPYDPNYVDVFAELDKLDGSEDDDDSLLDPGESCSEDEESDDDWDETEDDSDPPDNRMDITYSQEKQDCVSTNACNEKKAETNLMSGSAPSFRMQN